MSLPPLPAPENKLHYPGLDGLRALAVLMVFVDHYFVYPGAYHWGWVGVQIFFVLSGFLITGILYDTREASNRFRAFYARRALRIFPLFYAVLLAGWMLWPVFHWKLHPAWVLMPVYLSNFSRFLWVNDFFHGAGIVEHLRATRHGMDSPFLLYYGHFWSLAVEEQFYLVWPMVVFFVRDRRLLFQLCQIAVIAVPVARFLCLALLPSSMMQAAFAQRFTLLQCDALLLGAGLALVMRGEHRSLTEGARVTVWAVAGGFLAFQAGYFALHHVFYATDFASPFLVTFGFTIANLFGAGLLLSAIDPRTVTARVLNTRVLRWIGTVSYGFYVLHDIPHVAYERLAKAFPGTNPNAYGILAGALALGGTLLFSALSFRYLETPFLRLKSRFVAKSESMP